MQREFPDLPRLTLRFQGSFDCVVVRFADDNFAQDDTL